MKMVWSLGTAVLCPSATSIRVSDTVDKHRTRAIETNSVATERSGVDLDSPRNTHRVRDPRYWGTSGCVLSGGIPYESSREVNRPYPCTSERRPPDQVVR